MIRDWLKIIGLFLLVGVSYLQLEEIIHLQAQHDRQIRLLELLSRLRSGDSGQQ